MVLLVMNGLKRP